MSDQKDLPSSPSVDLARTSSNDEAPHLDLTSRGRRTVWLTGASGFLGSKVLDCLRDGDWRVAFIRGRHQVDRQGAWTLHASMTEPDSLRNAARSFRPDVIINCAAVSTIGDCRSNPARAWEVNVQAARHLATLAYEAHAHFIQVSTDMVFAGDAAPYREYAEPAPISFYGATKAAAEDVVRTTGGAWAILRCPLLFGERSGPQQQNQLEWMLEGLRAAEAGAPENAPTLFHDEWRTPAEASIVAKAIVTAAERTACGVFHLGGPERLSRVEFGRKVAKAWGLDPALVKSGSRLDYPGAEPRPEDLSLKCEQAVAALDYRHPPIADTLAELAKNWG